MPSGKFSLEKLLLEKIEKSKSKNLNFHYKKLEKEKQVKPIVNRKEEEIKSRNQWYRNEQTIGNKWNKRLAFFLQNTIKLIKFQPDISRK